MERKDKSRKKLVRKEINADRNMDLNDSGSDIMLSFFRTEVLKEELNQYESGKKIAPIDQLIADAEEALTQGPYSVIDKTTLPPSHNANDYWHPAPYWWPNPKTKDGMPYIRRDGKRVPGTRMYELESEKYDRTRLQYVFDDSITLALAWYFTKEKKYAMHGVRILERFFINPKTRMTPHLKYAQVRLGRNNNKGSHSGIIEMKDMYYYLDAIRLFHAAGCMDEETLIDFKKWLSSYLEWLVHSAQGEKEQKSSNNHGTFYDLQVAAIAEFLNNRSLLYKTLARSKARIREQFAKDGSQPKELKRNTTAHYCFFNFQGWIYLCEIANRWGMDLWSYKASNGSSLMNGAKWLLSHSGKEWPYKQADEFDLERYFPIWFSIPRRSFRKGMTDQFPNSKYSVKPRFFPYDGVRPYWNLGLGEYKKR
ncbi:alginate lyase family protein [Cytobacillus dafuensis]|nr:alginate lyase family protein [Cytobacillus dafuensis]